MEYSLPFAKTCSYYPGSIVSRENFLNIDKPLNTNSIDLIKKIKKIIRVGGIYSQFFFDKFISGCLILSFKKIYYDLKLVLEKDVKMVGVTNLNKDDKQQKNMLVRFLKKNLYYNTGSSNKRGLKFMNVKNLIIDEYAYKKNKILYFFRSKNIFFPDSLKTNLSIILRKNCPNFEIRQLRLGIFNENTNLIFFQDIFNTLWNLNFWKNFLEFKKILIPNQFVVKLFKRIVVKNSSINSLCYGSNLMAGGILAIEKNIEKGEIVALITQKKEIVALGKINFNSNVFSFGYDGVVIILRKIFMKKNHYPKSWKLGINASLKQILCSIKTK